MSTSFIYYFFKCWRQHK